MERNQRGFGWGHMKKRVEILYSTSAFWFLKVRSGASAVQCSVVFFGGKICCAADLHPFVRRSHSEKRLCGVFCFLGGVVVGGCLCVCVCVAVPSARNDGDRQ